MRVSVVGRSCFIVIPNLIQAQDGPPFTAPSMEENVGQKSDQSFFMVRTEVHCAQCEAHLGHVFDDGPVDAGGLRYCINSASLDFQKDE